jgi:hypothetical protein
MGFFSRPLASRQERSRETVAPGRIEGTRMPSRKQRYEFRRYVYETPGGGRGKDRLGVRSWARRWGLWPWGNRKVPGLGLINENGRPAWEDAYGEAGHEFRRHVYETLRFYQ